METEFLFLFIKYISVFFFLEDENKSLLEIMANIQKTNSHYYNFVTTSQNIIQKELKEKRII